MAANIFMAASRRGFAGRYGHEISYVGAAAPIHGESHAEP
jgi:hypothetical protein